MSTILEIKIFNFRESLRLAQRAVYIGLSMAAIIHYLSLFGQGEALPVMPFVGLEFSTVSSLQIAILCLYMGSGMVSCFAVSRAASILESIDDLKISAELSRYPSIVSANAFYGSVLAGALVGSGLLLVKSMYGLGGFKEYGFFVLVSLPFVMALQIGGRIYRYKKRQMMSPVSEVEDGKKEP